MRGVLGVEGVAGDDRVEVRLPAVVLGPQQSTEPLRLLLTRAERARHLHRDAGLGQVDREVGDLGHHERGDLTVAELVEQFLALLVGGRPLDDGRVELGAELLELVEVGADHQGGGAGMAREDLPDHRDLGAGGRAQLVLVLGLGGRVQHPLVLGERHAHLDAVGGRDPPLRLDVLPRGVVALGPDEGEHVALAAVLAHERRGQAEAAARLQVGGHAEHGRGQQVDLVVDHQAPVAGVEQLQRPVHALGLARDHLVCGDGDWPDLLALTGVLADLVLGEGGAGQQFPLPLAPGDGVGHQDERGGLGLGHRGRADHRLAGAAGQHDHAGAARPERVGGHLLVVAQLPLLLLGGQRDLVGLAVHVAGEVLGGPAHLEQLLLEPTALGGVHDHRVRVDVGAEHGGDLLVPLDLGEHSGVERDERQSVDRTLDQLQPAVARHGLGDVHEQRLGHGEARVGDQDVDHLLGVVPGGPGVPQGQRRDPVGVDVLGRALELGEGGQRLSGVGGLLVVDLQQHCLVRLDDQRSTAHFGPPRVSRRARVGPTLHCPEIRVSAWVRRRRRRSPGAAAGRRARPSPARCPRSCRRRRRRGRPAGRRSGPRRRPRRR